MDRAGLKFFQGGTMRLDTPLIRNTPNFLTAGAILTLTAAAVLAGAGAGPLPIVGSLVLSASCTLLLWCNSRLQARRTLLQWQNVDSDVADLTARTKTLLDHLSGEFSNQFAGIRTENDQLQHILSDAIERLVSSFTGLDEHTRNQQQLAARLMRRQGKEEAADPTFDSFLKDIEGVLRQFVDAADNNSRTARELKEQMEQTSSRFQQILGMLGEVKKIADQTNLLAINAAVEAARAGAAGKGFAVVAGEVRSLSVRSNAFSNQIGDSVQGISGDLSAVEGVIHQMADKDTKMVAETRERMTSLMAKTRDFNNNIAKSADEISGLSEKVSLEVRSAVTSLQFQDMANQILEHVQGRLSALEGALSRLNEISWSPAAGDGEPSDCDRRLQDFREWLDQASDTIRNIRHNPVSQKSMAEGEIELF